MAYRHIQDGIAYNHPSYVEPYFQGAATGVGGILRDIFTMGARPIAVLDSLRFGPISSGMSGLKPLPALRTEIAAARPANPGLGSRLEPRAQHNVNSGKRANCGGAQASARSNRRPLPRLNPMTEQLTTRRLRAIGAFLTASCAASRITAIASEFQPSAAKCNSSRVIPRIHS